jgi:uncharacterized protein (DUF924 family)
VDGQLTIGAPAQLRDDVWVAEMTDFWRSAGRQKWFVKDPAFDIECRDRFLDHHLAAAKRAYDYGAETPAGSLPLVLLLDQFPRNAFRGTVRMYATDPLARMFARRALAAGHDQTTAEDLRPFLYLPFGHSEDLADQELSVELNRALGPEQEKYAMGHRDIIFRFGRFPHRNPLLGRSNTRDEEAFLAAGGFAG